MRSNLHVTLKSAFVTVLFVLLCLGGTAQEKPEDGYIKTALSLYTSQQYDAAIEHCNKAIGINPQSAYAYNVRGTCYNQKKNYTVAVTDFTEALRLSPRYANAFYNRATAYNAQNNYALALSDYSNAILYQPANKSAYYDRGMLQYNNKNYNEAIKDFTATTNLDASNSLTFFYRGICYHNIKNYDAAIEDYTSTLKLDPAYMLAYYNRGNAYNSRGYTSKAIEDFTSSVVFDPNYYLAYFQRGKLYMDQKNYIAALSDFSQVIRLNPKYSDAFLYRGNVYYDVKEYDKAIPDYTENVTLSPASSAGFINLGLVYLIKKDYEKAILNFNQGLKIDPNSSDAYVSRGQAYAEKQKFEQAVADYTEAIRLNPRNANIFINRGNAYQNLEKYDLAFSDYTAAERLDPRNVYVPSSRGYTYLNMGEYEKALSEFSKAIAIDSKSKESFMGRALVNYYSSNWNAALADYNEALKIDPEYVFGYYGRGAAYVFNAEYSKAVADFQQSIKYDPQFEGAYINLLTTFTHTGEFDKAKEYLRIYRSRNLKHESSTKSWEFYQHYVNALLDGVLMDNFLKALDELNIAEKKYDAIGGTVGNKKNEAKLGYVDILFLRGYVLEKLERFGEARVSYEQSFTLNHNQHDIKEALKRIDKKTALAVNTDKTPPAIEILSPETTRSFDIVSDVSSTKIIGKAVDEGGIKSVIINGQAVSKVEEGGFFIQMLSLQEGQNTITVEATDKNNNKTTKSFTLNLKSATDKVVSTEPVKSVIDNPLTYHAILIAEQEYSDPSIPDLANPISDAMELKKILETNYTFDPKNVLVLENKSREEIMEVLIQRCSKLQPEDNLLVFYAGHGTAVTDSISPQEKEVEGYFVPVSARWKQQATYISADDIKSAFKKSPAKHILLIADACYSGAFTRSLPVDATIDIQKQYKLKSRKVMASGNLEPVPDKSEFIKYLKKRLKDNEENYLPADQLFNNFRKAVLVNSSTTPLYAPIQNANDEGGDFVFIKKK